MFGNGGAVVLHDSCLGFLLLPLVLLQSTSKLIIGRCPVQVASNRCLGLFVFSPTEGGSTETTQRVISGAG